jgi:hypothetical protein
VPASTTAAGCGNFFFTFLLAGLLYDMWGHKTAGPRDSHSKRFSSALQNICFLCLRYKSLVKTYSQSAASSPFPNQPPLLLLQSPLPPLLPPISHLLPYSPRSPISREGEWRQHGGAARVAHLWEAAHWWEAMGSAAARRWEANHGGAGGG